VIRNRTTIKTSSKQIQKNYLLSEAENHNLHTKLTILEEEIQKLKQHQESSSPFHFQYQEEVQRLKMINH
jgi:hypothetical protein